ncbi:polyprenyl synthetase family protein [Streptomyces sp. NPDC056534]|uniref:polyprenyl synthetase family protein n=1 Tax=Streptomyces sp. NPDC056534 TaxID=3345857 RepID=UPI0036B623F1
MLTRSHNEEKCSARESLTRCKTSVDQALRTSVNELPPAIRQIAGYQLGWWDAKGETLKETGGKSMRPALLLLTAEAVHGDPAAAVPAAVAVELAHNFSLIHDDVLDGDRMRRHRLAAWAVFGKENAILAGDAMLSTALTTLATCDHPARVEGVLVLHRSLLDLVSGEFSDLEFEKRKNVELSECAAMAEKKTATLLSASCALGAIFGGAPRETVTSMSEFGRLLGVAFQHIDDILGIWGDPSVTGKPIHSDLRSRKKSLPVVAALCSDTPEGRELGKIYARPAPLTDSDISHAADLVDAAGGRSWSQQQADGSIAKALDLLDRFDLESKAKTTLAYLATMLADRTS